MTPPHGRKLPLADRAKVVDLACTPGVSLDEAGRAFGITREYVRLLVVASGRTRVPLPKGKPRIPPGVLEARARDRAVYLAAGRNCWKSAQRQARLNLICALRDLAHERGVTPSLQDLVDRVGRAVPAILCKFVGWRHGSIHYANASRRLYRLALGVRPRSRGGAGHTDYLQKGDCI